tara:strand:- start:1662 stop:1931 length:270 start_codon:yes stop_codon:yes gene_type:complete
MKDLLTHHYRDTHKMSDEELNQRAQCFVVELRKTYTTDVCTDELEYKMSIVCDEIRRRKETPEEARIREERNDFALQEHDEKMRGYGVA